MYPIVRAPLLALNNGHRLVMRPRVLDAWVRVEAVRPQHRAPLFGHHGDVNVRELRAAALLHIGEIEEEGEGARPACGV